VSLARLTSGGSGGRIRRLLGPVYEGFAEGFDTPDLVEAGELLSTLA
jgi:predicted ATPase